VLKEFRDFAVKGNLVDLAVAFILGLFFAAVVTALVNDVILALIAAAFGQPNFGSLTAHVGHGVVKYGLFIQAVVNFLVVAWVLFFVVKGMNRLMPPPPPKQQPCPFCQTSIPIEATRCPACTSDLRQLQASSIDPNR
jgi:large conductance mechanosensitive channel